MNQFNKTDEELEKLSEQELFAYLDAKANYLKQYTKPLSPYKATRFAALGNAISNIDKGTDKINETFPDIQKIRKQANKDSINYLMSNRNETE